MRRSCAPSPFSILRKMFHFQPCFGQNFSSQEANFPNFRSQDPSFFKEHPLPRPYFWKPTWHTPIHKITRHVPPKDPTFFARFHRKTPIFTNFHPMTPIFNKLLVTRDPDTSLSLKDPSFSPLVVKQVTIFGNKLDFSKILTNLMKC